MKLDAVYKHHCPDGHVCRTIVEARCSRNGAGTGVTKSCLDPTRTISAGIVTAGQSIGTFGILSVSRETCILASRFSCCSRGSRVPSFEEGCAMNAWRYPLVDVLRVQRAANNAARRVTGMDVIAQAQADREMEHASSTQRDHVSRETRRQRCH